MHQFSQRDLDYVMRLDEVMWGCLLVSVTIIIHGVGLFYTMRLSRALRRRASARPSFDLAVITLAALMIVVLHLVEVMVWAGFFTWKHAQPNRFSAFYYALVNYTTLGAGYLPLRWRLLEPLLAMAGLISFAFSTSALIALTRDMREERQKTEPAHVPNPDSA